MSVSLRKKIASWIMILGICGTLQRSFSKCGGRQILFVFSAAAQSEECVSNRKLSSLRRLQVQVVHRHGDRTPITPLKDEDYWKKQLIGDDTLHKISSNTKLIEPEDTTKRHVANGRGPFGKLTELGLFQMVKLGRRLKDSLEGNKEDSLVDEVTGVTLLPYLFHKDRPLAPQNIRILSTNFQRTIQSVQGLLVGIFPDSTKDFIEIDTRHTNWMIPDPHPRRTVEQAQLEQELSKQEHFIAKERELYPLAIRATTALHKMLAADAREANFGVRQAEVMLDGDHSIEIQPLSWNQLAEITKCLAVRDMLPEGIAKSDQELILNHAAWCWFQTFSDQRLARLAMGTMTDAMIASMKNYAHEPAMTIWSAHDSTLICLLCAFRLEQPALWPEYASHLMIELFENVDDKELYVRFSLNGSSLKYRGNGEPSVFVPLSSIDSQLQQMDASVL